MAIPGLVYPDFLNLGVAPPAPQGAEKYAPRLKFAPLYGLGDPFTRVPRATNSLVTPVYTLPARGQPGDAQQQRWTAQLLPNPYSGP